MVQSYNLFVSFLTSLKQQLLLLWSLFNVYTISCLPLKNGKFILSSYRDESRISKRFPPKKYLGNGIDIVYPKDELAYGA